VGHDHRAARSARSRVRRNRKIPTHLTVTSPIDGIVVAKQITQGQYLNVGDSPFTVADLRDLWLQVKLYERDIPLVSVGDPVSVRVDAMSSETFDGVVAFKGYQLDSMTRTLDARVVVGNAGLALRTGNVRRCGDPGAGRACAFDCERRARSSRGRHA
jgi:Cu(I)/Ag(I) efflux system membrane fusion protein